MNTYTYQYTLNKTLLLFLLFASTQLRAGEYLYNAEVEGMVCAFCAYSVSKNISKLPGVDADSVDVDLDGGYVRFYSSQPVDEAKLSALFTDSGFTISQLKQSEARSVNRKTEEVLALTLEIDRDKIEQYKILLENLGNLAASSPSHLLIEAPADDESKLLKPILMGRQQVVKLRFKVSESNKIVIKLFTGKV